MLSEEQRREAAEALLAAERTREWIKPLTTTYPAADIEDAYRVSMLVTQAKVAAGRQVKGHKSSTSSACGSRPGTS